MFFEDFLGGVWLERQGIYGLRLSGFFPRTAECRKFYTEAFDDEATKAATEKCVVPVRFDLLHKRQTSDKPVAKPATTKTREELAEPHLSRKHSPHLGCIWQDLPKKAQPCTA